VSLAVIGASVLAVFHVADDPARPTRTPEYARPATAGRSDEHAEKTHWLILRVQGGAGTMTRTRSVPSSRTTT
jgi:hypothetical protein